MPDEPAQPEATLPADRAQRTLATRYAIVANVHQTDAPNLALTRILDALVSHFRAASGSIALLNPDSGKLEIEVHYGLYDPGDDVALRMGQGVTGWVAFHGKPLLVPDVAVEPRYVCVRETVRSEMAVPMLDHRAADEAGQVLGVVNLDSDTLGGFSEEDLEDLVSLTAEATAVLQRLWQLQQLRGKARTLESLLTIGQALVTKLEPQTVLDTVARDARLVTQSRACALYLHDPATGTLEMAALSNPLARGNPRPALHEALPIDSCVLAAPIHTRKQIEFTNIQGPEFLDIEDLPRDERLRSLLATPMLSGSEIVGVLAVFTDHLHRFNNDEKRLCSTLASLATVALENSRLYARVFQSENTLRNNERLTTLGLLAAEIAHEIRNPLTVLKLLFGQLRLDFPDDDPRRTDVRVIGEKIDQLEALVTRVLNFAKAPTSVHSRWSLAEIVSDTLVLIRLKLDQAKVDLEWDPPARPMLVDGHKGQLQQVLLNVLLNATQAMPDGGSILIAASMHDRGHQHFVHLDVTDTGNGIPEAIAPRIFDSFLSGRPDGTGLGLAIAKRILASHHGDILLVGTSPAGTTVRIILPLART